jgi:hypothetical protein
LQHCCKGTRTQDDVRIQKIVRTQFNLGLRILRKDWENLEKHGENSIVIRTQFSFCNLFSGNTQRKSSRNVRHPNQGKEKKKKGGRTALCLVGTFPLSR